MAAPTSPARFRILRSLPTIATPVPQTSIHMIKKDIIFAYTLFFRSTNLEFSMRFHAVMDILTNGTMPSRTVRRFLHVSICLHQSLYAKMSLLLSSSFPSART